MNLWNSLSQTGVDKTNNPDQKRNLILFNRLVMLFWVVFSSVLLLILILFPQFADLGPYFLIPLTVFSLVLILNKLVARTISFIFFLLSIFLMSYVDNWLAGIPPVNPYISYNTHLLMAFVVAQISLVVGKKNWLNPAISIALFLLFFLDYALVEAIWDEAVPDVELLTYMNLKFAFFILFLSIFIYTRMMKSVLSTLMADLHTMREALEKSKELLKSKMDE